MARKAKKTPAKKQGRKKAKAPVKSAVPSAVVEPAKRGRPSRYTKAIAEEILHRMSHGETLNRICRDEHMPARTTIIGWKLADIDGFADTYARAREGLLEYWEDETIDIADDGSNDYRNDTDDEGKTTKVVDHDHIQRSRLRVETRKWMLGKLNQKRFGDKIEQTHKADAGFLELWKHVSSQGEQ